MTSNGKPIALISSASEETLEESLQALRRARAMMAVQSVQMASVKSGRHRITGHEINAEILKVRQKHFPSK